jgi:hypothetical protein
MKRIIGTQAILALTLHLFAHAGLANAPAADPAAEVEPPHNLCFGGLEHRKRIVPEAQLRDPLRETTHLGCQVDGGEPAVMPDLPRPSRIRYLVG